jgi:1-phosphofructokinase/tagatose 6-phosphate kinase
MRAEPTPVAPNELEAEELVGHEFGGEEDRARALREIVELGARETVMTLPSGCIALVGEEPERRCYRVTLEPREAVSTVGSGDAFLAGYVAARYTGEAPEDCLRFAVACGAESTQHFGAGMLDPRGAERLVNEVKIEPLAEPALGAPS